MKHGLVGAVASVNGVSDPTRAGLPTRPARSRWHATNDKTFTVNVATDTKFQRQGRRGHRPVVRERVRRRHVAAKGHRRRHDRDRDESHRDPAARAEGAFGTVASVNGVSDPNTCGTADAAGSFTLTGRDGQTFTVNVDPATEYRDKDVAVTDPSFANVCVGSFVARQGHGRPT